MELKKKDKTIAIILAGGVGSRMAAEIPKQYMELAGKPVLAHSLIAFEKSPVDGIFVVCGAAYKEMIQKDIVTKYGIKKFSGFADSGSERVWSVKNGIDAVLGNPVERCKTEERKTCENIYLMIHDGARPLISQELIARCMAGVKEYAAVVPGLPLKDTIKEISGDDVVSTPDRNKFVAVQTPQCFRGDVIIKAYEGYAAACGSNEQGGFIPTDDASLVEMFTETGVKVVPGDEDNLKMTVPSDMKKLEMMLDGS